MKLNKYVIILISILIILIIIITTLLISIKNQSTFIEPKFEENITTQMPEEINYKSQAINLSQNYSIYIDGVPKIENDNLIINFISLEDNNVWIKVRILNEKRQVVAESGLIKPGEYLKSVKTIENVVKNDKLTYMIIGYEIDTYLSAGTVELNIKVGD